MWLCCLMGLQYRKVAGYRRWTAEQCRGPGLALVFGTGNLLRRTLNTWTTSSMGPAHLWEECNWLTVLFHFLIRFELQFKWLTKTRLNAAGVDPDFIPNATAAAEGHRGIGAWTVTPPHTNIAGPTAGAPLGPLAPATVHCKKKCTCKTIKQRRWK